MAREEVRWSFSLIMTASYFSRRCHFGGRRQKFLRCAENICWAENKPFILSFLENGWEYTVFKADKFSLDIASLQA